MTAAVVDTTNTNKMADDAITSIAIWAASTSTRADRVGAENTWSLGAAAIVRFTFINVNARKTVA
jgi:hypothetical protein